MVCPIEEVTLYGWSMVCPIEQVAKWVVHGVLHREGYFMGAYGPWFTL